MDLGWQRTRNFFFFLIDCLCIAFDLFLNPELIIERKLWNSVYLWLWKWGARLKGYSFGDWGVLLKDRQTGVWVS